MEQYCHSHVSCFVFNRARDKSTPKCAYAGIRRSSVSVVTRLPTEHEKIVV